MGRGRAKAKQAKIARELKYFSPPTDLTALQNELGGAPQPQEASPSLPSHRLGEPDDNSAH
jgi:hypothetical protein